MENKIRRMVYNIIVTYPGVSFTNIKNIFELTDSNLRYHLNYLEKNNKISSGVVGGVKSYYPHPSSVAVLRKPEQVMESQKLTPEQQHILTIIKQYPGINQKDLVNISRMNRQKLMRNLETLKNLNMITNMKIQNNVYYECIPDAEMKFVMLKGIIIKFLNNEIDEQTFLKLKEKLG
jgi:predicted transcriptional regulator